MSHEIIAEASHWKGDAKSFVEAMIKAGFIDSKENELTVHDWKDYAGKLLEYRERDKKRKAAVRRMSDGRPKDVRRMSTVTVPYRTVPKESTKERSSQSGQSNNGGAIDQEKINEAIEAMKAATKNTKQST